MVRRNDSELITVVQNTSQLGAGRPADQPWHQRAGSRGKLDLLPFEQQLVDIVNKFIVSSDNAERVELMKQFQKIYTENVYDVGLTDYPGALIINKRFSQHPAGHADLHVQLGRGQHHPRARVVPTDKQQDYELHPRHPARQAGRRRPVK